MFGDDYAEVYDAFYRDKDYRSETQFLLDVAGRRAERPIRSVLDLGCGTGGHAFALAERGLDVLGVDLSQDMLRRAETIRAARGGELRGHVQFALGDAREFRVDRIFDLVVSLFHVMSYQVGDDDVRAMLATARRHLSEGGLFAFDFWHGPAVLADPPVERRRVWEFDGRKVERLSRPVWEPERDLVKVVYDIELTSERGEVRRRTEEHPMRYFFRERLEPLVREEGFEVVEAGAWGSGAPLTADVFGAYVAATAR